MLFHPGRDRLDTLMNTRLVATDIGLVGKKVRCPKVNRVYTLTHLFTPLPGGIAGLRARGVDSKGFSSFINQRDLEVLLGLGHPGLECPWLGKNYVDVADPEWFGVCMDPRDSEDDLLVREMDWAAAGGQFTYGASLLRRVHWSEDRDVEEEWLFLSNQRHMEPKDVALRWTRADSQRVKWNNI